MTPRLTLLATALVLGAAPLPALAQGWPATVVAAAPHMSPPTGRPLVVVRKADVSVQRRDRLPPTDPTTRGLRLSEAEAAPDVALRPKAEWTNDEGWRASPTRIAFKRRF